MVSVGSGHVNRKRVVAAARSLAYHMKQRSLGWQTTEECFPNAITGSNSA